MATLWIAIVLLSLLAATVGALIALRIQYRILEEGRQEREAWREAQEGRQRTWEVRQAKHNLEVEKQLSTQLKDLRREWQGWQQEWHDLAEQDQQTLQLRANLEQELARLPHIEDVELPLNAHGPRQQPDRWQPPALYQADLRGRDLSHRYMGRADLREAHLAGANLYMADLTGASLTGANLEGANLAGANLCGADLRGANLRGANLLVTDLHNAILQHAVLLDARGITLQQLHTTIYDSTTSIDDVLPAALEHTPGVHITPEETSALSPEALPDTAVVSEPEENEMTIRMPLLGRTKPKKAEVTRKSGAKRTSASAPDASTEAAAPAHASAADQGEEEKKTNTRAAEFSSPKIIQWPTRSSKTEPPSETKRAGNKKKGTSRTNKISNISRKQG